MFLLFFGFLITASVSSISSCDTLSQSELLTLDEYQEKAKGLMNEVYYNYYSSGAGAEYTLGLNEESFKSLRIRPRYLVDVSNISTKLEILGSQLDCPLGISPAAMQRLAHPEGEIATAKAIKKNGGVFILSTMSTTSIEDLAENTPNMTKWFQLYIFTERNVTENLIRRAEAAGFQAIVLTLDTLARSTRRSTRRFKWIQPSNVSFANFYNVSEYLKLKIDVSLTWKDLTWLVEFTKLPVIVKGILTREDALLAVEHGAVGIIVSNQGARQQDYTPATIEALPEIVKAVGGKCTVMLDGGIREGSDIFKALAFGAKMVFMGRPALWGLAVCGQEGVENILDLVLDDFKRTMIQSGCPNISQITRSRVVHQNYYLKLLRHTKNCC